MFQVFDSVFVAQVVIGMGRQIKDHTVVNIFEAYDLLIVEVGQHLVQLMNLGEDTGEGEAAAVDIGSVGLEAGGELVDVLH